MTQKELISDISGEFRADILRQYRDGASVVSLARQHDILESQMRRLIAQERYAQVMQLPLEFMPNPAEFQARNAEREILAPLPPAKSATAQKRAPKGLPAYLASLYEVPLLSGEQERHLFRQYNYLKYRASKLRDSMSPKLPSLRVMDQIEAFFRQAVEAKNHIVRANLRLVVSIAKKYSSDHEDVFDLTSEGNMSLMRAVEKFDYARGTRLSTYATWAITRNFARAYHNRINQSSRFRTGQEEMTDLTDNRSDPQLAERAQHLNEMNVAKILDCLSEREREIVAKRFGLTPVTPPRTLKQIGAEMGVSKERVRQIEKVALGKLREAAEQAKIESTAA